MRTLAPRQWFWFTVFVVALAAFTAAAWPLVPFLLDLVPDGLPLGRIALGSLFGAAALAALTRLRRSPVWLGWFIAGAWAVAIAVVAAMSMLVWLLLGSPGLTEIDQLSPKALDAIATRVFAVVAGLGGVALLAIHYRRQRTTENGEQREVAKLFTESFDSASELDFAAFREVRHTLIRIIGNRLREPTRWRGKDYDFTGVVFDGGDLTKAVFSDGRVDFTGAEFTGDLVEFDGAEFSGARVSFIDAEFSCGHVGFSAAEFTGGEVNFDNAKFSGGDVSFTNVEFTGARVSFDDARFSSGGVEFDGVRFSGGEVSFDDVDFSGGGVDFSDASGMCPSGLRTAIERGGPHVVVGVPESWQRAVQDDGHDDVSSDIPREVR